MSSVPANPALPTNEPSSAAQPSLCRCPACAQSADSSPLEHSHQSALYACARCGLQFWHPAKMPDASWYEAAYQGRDAAVMPLEPGHLFFLSDPQAPRKGRLLDIGCGTGNFLAAARAAGFAVTGIEPNQNAARVAQERYDLREVFAILPTDFQQAHPLDKFDTVTFFEVLEHQEDPRAFLHVAKALLKENGFVALSVPNGNRWQVGPDTLDRPPNHLTRWRPAALRNFLESNGFQVLSLREQPLGVRRAAQMLSATLRTGLMSHVAGERPPGLADLAEMSPSDLQKTMDRVTTGTRHVFARKLSVWKNRLMLPVALVLLPYFRWRGRTGLYLYCLARLQDPSSALGPAVPARKASGLRERLDMPNPLVSVLIDTYNHERFIEEAIVSVLQQDFPHDDTEILVVDDGSTDRTPEIVRQFEPRLRLIRKPNGGQASAFNAGIPEARGEIVAFLDGDDWWAPNKLSRVMQAMSADPAIGFVGHGIVIVFLDGRMQSETLCEGFRFQANSAEGVRLFRRRGSFMGTSRMAIRADLLRRIGAVPESLVVQADEYLFTLAAVLAGVQILPETLTHYRLHDANGFLFSVYNPQLLRRKQQVLAALAQALGQELRSRQVPPEVATPIVEIIQAQSDQIRLRLDGGWPWETVQTEQKIYAVAHPEAPLAHRVFKAFALLPACVVPPRFYYAMQQKLATSDVYLRARSRWLPVPQMPHIQKVWRTGK